MITAPSFTLRVNFIRVQNPKGRGGAIFSGIEVDAQGQRVDAKSHFVVKALLDNRIHFGGRRAASHRRKAHCRPCNYSHGAILHKGRQGTRDRSAG